MMSNDGWKAWVSSLRKRTWIGLLNENKDRIEDILNSGLDFHWAVKSLFEDNQVILGKNKNFGKHCSLSFQHNGGYKSIVFLFFFYITWSFPFCCLNNCQIEFIFRYKVTFLVGTYFIVPLFFFCLNVLLSSWTFDMTHNILLISCVFVSARWKQKLLICRQYAKEILLICN